MANARSHFPTVYVTLASILLGLAIEDLVSIVRDIEHRDAFVWMTSIFVVHIIMNAWIAFSTIAIAVELEPHPWDAINVFALSASHFALNSFVGAEPAAFFLAAGVYSLTAAGVVYYNVWRASQDPALDLLTAGFRRVIAFNASGGVVFTTVGILALLGGLSPVGELAGAVLLFPFATGWLLLFWRAWTGSTTR